MKKTIGIIGGMGPLATSDLFYKIIQNTDAKSDKDHIHIVIDNNPMIPDRTLAIMHGGISPVPYILESANSLVRIGANILTMPCNTSHAFYKEITKHLEIPLINMVEETVKEVKKRKIRRIGVLGTDGLIFSNVYGEQLANEGIEPIIPTKNDQEAVMDVIYRGIKAGDMHFSPERFQDVLANIRNRGADIVILGCTELPIAVKQYGIECNYIDPTEILAKKAIEIAGFNCK